MDVDAEFKIELCLFQCQHFWARMGVGQKPDCSVLVVPVDQMLLLCLPELYVQQKSIGGSMG